MLTGIRDRSGEHTWASLFTGMAHFFAVICTDGCHPELPLKNVWPEEEFERSGLDDIIGICLELRRHIRGNQREGRGRMWGSYLD